MCQSLCRDNHSASHLVPGTLLLEQVWVCRAASAMYFPCLQLGGFAFIGEGIPVGLGAAFKTKYMKVSLLSSLPTSMLLHVSSGCGKSASFLQQDLTLPAQGTSKTSPALTCQAAVLSRLMQCTVASLDCLEQGLSTLALQDAVGDDSADQVSVNFFGDGTCNMGEANQYACLT